MAQTYDLIVRGGEVANHAGRGMADVGVRDGRIAFVGDLSQASDDVKAMIQGLAPNHSNLHCNESSPIYVLEITEAGSKRKYSSDNNHCAQNANYAGYVPTQAMAQLAHTLSKSQAY